jgi:hypothetical protein
MTICLELGMQLYDWPSTDAFYKLSATGAQQKKPGRNSAPALVEADKPP